MRIRFPLLLALLALASLTCQAVSRVILPELQGQSLDPAALDRAGARLNTLLVQDDQYGELYDIDSDQNGSFDEVIYHFPPRQLETDVQLQTNLVYSSGETAAVPQPGVYYKAYLLFPENLSQQEKQVRFTFEIPKDFARSVDELTFQPQPSQIINPDPVVQYDLVLAPKGAEPGSYRPPSGEIQGLLAAPGRLGSLLPAPASPRIVQPQIDADSLYIGSALAEPIESYVVARARMRNQAIVEMYDACKSMPPDLKSACYLSMVADFKDMLGKQEMEQICTGEVTGYERRLCLSIARDRAAECDRLTTAEDIFTCKGFYVQQKCKGLEGGELQGCLKDQSIANKAPLGCLDLQDPDVRNDCFARAGNDAGYCKRINNTARREACEQALRPAAPAAPRSIDPSRWFSKANADEECQPFYRLFPEYKVNYSMGDEFNGVATLSCSMDATDPNLDDLTAEVSIQVWGDPSVEIAREKWNDETDGYTYAGKKKQEQTNSNPNLTFTFGTDTYYSVLKMPTLNDAYRYIMAGGSLYQNARLAFHFTAFADSPERWRQVETVFKQLVDRMLR